MFLEVWRVLGFRALKQSFHILMYCEQKKKQKYSIGQQLESSLKIRINGKERKIGHKEDEGEHIKITMKQQLAGQK